jgi:hypothetical protein
MGPSLIWASKQNAPSVTAVVVLAHDGKDLMPVTVVCCIRYFDLCTVSATSQTYMTYSETLRKIELMHR